MGSFDLNKGLDVIAGTVGKYFDQKMFSNNPAAAAAYFGTMAGNTQAGNTQPGYTQSTPPTAPADGQRTMDTMVMVLMGVAIGGAVMAFTK